MTDNPLLKLRQLGQQVWLDDIRRELFRTGELARLIHDDGLAGLTSNPAIFAKAIEETDDYQSDILSAHASASAETVYEGLAIADVRAAADAFAATYRETDGVGGYVSLEVSPHLARDTQGTIAAAKRLWDAVARRNLMIKIPATAEGLPAIQRSIAAGININITLIFSVARYEQVFDAFAAGMAERVQSGQPVERIASVASFFISRIDTLVDGMLVEKIKKGDAAVERLSGTAGIASAGAAMRVYRDCIAKPAWQELARAGARPQQLLWASTSTKNPAYSDIKYIEGLIAPDTINTIPPQTLAAYRDHGDPKVRIDDAVRDAPRVMAALADRGIHMNEVADELEAEALKKFSEPFDKLLAVIDKARKART